MEPIRIMTSPNTAKKTKFSFSQVNQWFSKRWRQRATQLTGGHKRIRANKDVNCVNIAVRNNAGSFSLDSEKIVCVSSGYSRSVTAGLPPVQ